VDVQRLDPIYRFLRSRPSNAASGDRRDNGAAEWMLDASDGPQLNGRSRWISDWKQFLIHDRDPLFTAEMKQMLGSVGVKALRLPPRSPNLNAYAERFVRTIKESCLDRMILFGEAGLRRAIREFIEHYHYERNHQALGNRLIVPCEPAAAAGRPIHCRERLGGMLKFYYARAA